MDSTGANVPIMFAIPLLILLAVLLLVVAVMRAPNWRVP